MQQKISQAYSHRLFCDGLCWKCWLFCGPDSGRYVEERCGGGDEEVADGVSLQTNKDVWRNTVNRLPVSVLTRLIQINDYFKRCMHALY